MTGEFILFWVLVNQPVGAQGGLTEEACAEAAQRMRVAVTSTMEPAYVEDADGQRHETRGEIWCQRASM